MAHFPVTLSWGNAWWFQAFTSHRLWEAGGSLQAVFAAQARLVELTPLP